MRNHSIFSTLYNIYVCVCIQYLNHSDSMAVEVDFMSTLFIIAPGYVSIHSYLFFPRILTAIPLYRNENTTHQRVFGKF